MLRVSIGASLLTLCLGVPLQAQESIDFREVVRKTAPATFELTWETPKNKSQVWRVKPHAPGSLAVPPNTGSVPKTAMPVPTGPAIPPVPPVPPIAVEGVPLPMADSSMRSYHAYTFRGVPLPQQAARVGFAVGADLIVSIDVPQDKVKVAAGNGDAMDGEVVIRDHVTGLAAIRVEGEELDFLAIAEEVGDPGEPVVLNWMPGSVVASQSSMIATEPFPSEHQWGFVQMLDAPVDMKKVGAPVLRADGMLIGVLVNKPTGSFCLSPEHVRRLVDAANSEEPKDLVRGRLGLQLGNDNSSVHAVMPETPAAKANLLAGDVIVRVGDAPCETHLDVLAALSMYRAGDKVELELERNDESIIVGLELSGLSFAIASNESEETRLAEAMQNIFQLKDGRLVPLAEAGKEVLEKKANVVVRGLHVERSKLEESLKALEQEKMRQDKLIEQLQTQIAELEAEANEKMQKAREVEEQKLEKIVEEIRERLRSEGSDQ